MSEYRLDNLLENFATGRFSNKLILVLGTFWFLNGMEVTMVTLIIPRLHCRWDLTPFQSAAISSPFFLGMAFGSIFWGWLGDRHGRKYLMVTSALMVMYFDFLTPASSTYEFFTTTQFFVGIGTAGAIITGAYVVEFTGTKSRGKALSLLNMFFAFGHLFVATLGYFVMNSYGWRIFILVKSSVMPVIILLLLWLPESLRYLQNNGQFDKLFKTLHRISIQNRRPLPKDIVLEKRNTTLQGQISVLFSKEFRLTTLLLMFLWFTVVVTYYSIVLLNTFFIQYRVCDIKINALTTPCHSLTDTEYFQNTLVVFGEFVAIVISFTFIEKVRRKAIILVAGILIAICLIIIACCPGIYVYTIIMAIARGLSAITVQTTWLLTAECYPTFVRATGIGLCHGAANFMLVLTPFMVQLIVYYSLPLLCGTLVVMCCLMGATVSFLNETKGIRII